MGSQTHSACQVLPAAIKELTPALPLSQSLLWKDFHNYLVHFTGLQSPSTIRPTSIASSILALGELKTDSRDGIGKPVSESCSKRPLVAELSSASHFSP